VSAYNADVKQAILDADAAINREDLDAVADFYTDDAVLVLSPGVFSRGKADIRKALAVIADHFNHSLRVTQNEMVVIEAGDTALVLADCSLQADAKTDSPFGMERRATYVFKKDLVRGWLCAIDNSYGTDLLNS
jgi:uncharacterized protein (TIGR02246 family)